MYKSIQCLRAVAAVLVVLFHLGIALASAKYFAVAPLESLLQFGKSGVPVFFVLSGFIIAWVHANDFGRPERLSGYIRRRAVRIYPAYFIVFAVTYLFLWISPQTRAAAPHDLAILIKSLALIPQDKTVVGGTGAPVLIVAWSLQYEICFYALVALTIVSRALGLLVVTLLAANFIYCHAGHCTFPRSFFANDLFLLFGLGVVIAHLIRGRRWLQRPRLLACVAAAGFLACAMLETTLGPESFAVDRSLVYGGFSGVLLLALVQAEDAGQLTIRRRWPVLLGDASYALYLIHYPLIIAWCKLLHALGLNGAAGAAIAFCPILAACMLAAVGFHVLVERPLLRALAPAANGRAARREPGNRTNCGHGREAQCRRERRADPSTPAVL
jgi:peptidoglycan/LPS O-acetylase OafA/YrhL